MSLLPQSRARRWLVFVVLAAVALPCGYVVARHYAWPAYKHWREMRLARMTESFMAAGDYENALLTARRALRDNQRSLPHWKLAAKAAKAKGTSDVIYYQMNVARLEKKLPSQLELIRLALQFNDYRDALEAVEQVDAAGKRNAEYHTLAARTYMALGRPVAAKLHLYSLISLQPDNHSARLDLDEIELAEDSEGKNADLRKDIRQLSTVPELKVRSLALLLKDALNRNQSKDALALAGEMDRIPNLTGDQRVMVLAGLSLGAPERADEYRHRLQTDFANDPSSVIALTNYYREHGSPAEARHWFDSLPRETKADPGVQEAIAAAFLEWKEWARLDQAVSGTQWKDREFMRNAFSAYSARKNGRLADAGNFWRLAVIQAGDSARNTSELLALVGRWGWQSEQYDLVWKLFALMPRNESISRQLIAWERAQGHTANLNRIFARLFEFGGDDRMLRNNFAYSSLLLDANLAKAHELAQANYRAEPSNPFYVTTEAFSLYKQNKPADALALLETLRPAALSTPERTMFHALYRAATGDAAGAADLLSGLKSAGFLPEERRLVTRTTNDIARLNGQLGEDQRLYAANSRGEIDRRKGWLQAMPEKVRTTATVEMQNSDSLFAMGDLSALSAQLHQGAWGDREHLRFALTAYAARGRGDSTSASSYWRTALGSATGDQEKLAELEALASQWNWIPEKMDVLARIFDIDASNGKIFAQLMDYYRSAGRTVELVGVLNSYLTSHPSDQEQLSEFAYYSMLSGLNVARAYVAAQEAYNAAPTENARRLVYAFALWKQHRAPEAWDLLKQIKTDRVDVVPVSLLRAAVLADLDRREDATRMLKTFDRKKALPEEASLAAVVASRLKEVNNVSGLN